MIKKKILAGMLSAVLVLTTNVGFASADTDKFTDINGHWGQSIINEAASLGIVGGYPEGNFLPDNLMKREEFYKLIVNVLTVKPDTANTAVSFKDVDPIEWYVPTIKTAVAAGITKGYEDGAFGVGQMISRQEAAKVVASVISTENLDTSKNASTAKDAAIIGEWALPYVNIMFQKGYMQGDNEGNFRPTMALTRAEAATLLLNVKKKETVIKGPGATGVTPAPETTTPTGTAGCQRAHSVTAGAFTVGTGTAKDPYEVSTEAQLNHIRIHMSEGGYYKLTKDIKITSDFATTVPNTSTSAPNWSEGNFEPIGTEDNPFVGNFDGNSHSISGLNITGTVKGSTELGNIAGHAGLFGYVDSKSTIDGLTIEKSTIKGSAYVGGIVGYNKGSITNCVLGSDSTVTGQSNVGGIVGYSKQNIKSNINKGTVEGTSTNTGGIVGTMDVEGDALYSCVNKGTVKGKSKTGGVVGYIAASSATVNIEKCSNAGKVSSSANFAGGVAGQVDGSSYGVYITDCYNTGELSGEGANGGVIGYAKGDRTKISDCYNTGEINGKNSGGIVGSNEGDIEKCYNKGKIIADTEAGGIVAYQNTGEGRIQKCYNDGNVTANSNAGGIAGLSKDKIFNCYNTGTIKATNSAGGLTGLNYAPIQRSYNAGEVKGSNGIGSLTGRNRAKLTNCFWLTGTCDTDIGAEDSGSSKSIVMKLSKEQLSGQVKVKLDDGFQLLTNYLNNKDTSKVWEYTYRIEEAATSESSSVISDGGGVVPPISISTTDEKGNVISPSDLNSGYIYPSLIDLKR
ncbi:S-layer homology domain-containing protein [Aminipila sp.]|uniref:S-layer homology domain-containing protein n=1 Tax=Aminipila sp. TaxID=2060095 RepID=UPI00289F982E|nr:S-layer homology domain-containing protein [Aminipila sp.]